MNNLKKLLFFSFIALAFVFQSIYSLSVFAANDFGKGKNVQVTAATALRFRAKAGLDGQSLGSQKMGSVGKILEGPVAANGFTWWKIIFENGATGWSADRYLKTTETNVGALSGETVSGNILGTKIVANKFNIGDKVSVNSGRVNVRSSASIYSGVLGSQKISSIGKVMAGPVTSGGYVWWNIDFVKRPDGWVVEKYLDLVEAVQVPITEISTTTTTAILPTPTTTTPIVIPTSTTPTTATTTQITATTTIVWGAFLGTGSPSTIGSLEQQVGKTANIQATFIGWNDSFPVTLARDLKASGKKMVIYWEQYGVTLDSIISGQSDNYIQTFAAAAKSSGTEIILAPLHEMNGNWDPWDGTVGNNTPEKVIATWKKIHDYFGGIDNVKFAWDVNNVSVPDTAANAIEKYYPGDSYVDYVAVDGFNFGTDSWDQVFPSSLITRLSSYNKPVYILSTAAVANSSKAAWIKDMGAGIKKYPVIAGWVWFNHNGSDGNWLLNSDQNSLEAFKAIIP